MIVDDEETDQQSTHYTERSPSCCGLYSEHVIRLLSSPNAQQFLYNLLMPAQTSTAHEAEQLVSAPSSLTNGAPGIKFLS